MAVIQTRRKAGFLLWPSFPMHHIWCTNHILKSSNFPSVTLKPLIAGMTPYKIGTLPQESSSTPVPAKKKNNFLFCGDNLEILRKEIPSDSVDLIYLDPPFKSDKNYNLLFRQKDGALSGSQILAFEDTWEWNKEAERNFIDISKAGGQLGQLIELFHVLLGKSDMMAYIAMMAPRLVELHKVLKPTGSIYLHCDPTASHYLKTLMDAIFGPQNFQNEVAWKRSHAHNSANRFGCNHDILLFYSKSETHTWNKVFHDYDPEYLAKHYRHIDKDGRRYKHENPTGAGISNGVTGEPWRGINPTVKGRHWAKNPDELDRLDAAGLIHWPSKKGAWPYIKVYLKENHGTPAQDIWSDIDPLNMMAKERLGYPTQKPLQLLERIINASSNDGDIILDPFCGCGTAIEAAIKKNRRWIGIDITYEAMRVIREERFPKLAPEIQSSYEMIYRPCDMRAAEAFAKEQPFQFQDWAVEKLGGVPSHSHSSDKGVDGRLYFYADDNKQLKQIIISVKGGKLKASFLRELQGAVMRDRAPMGILLTLNEPTRQMRKDADGCGFYTCASGTYPKIQFITINDMLSDAHLHLPPLTHMDERKRQSLALSARQLSLPGVAG